MNGITFNRQNGGLGRRLPGEDHVSGLLIYDGNQDFNSGTPTWIDSIENLESYGAVTAERHAVLHYHVSEYFRINPGSRLLVSQSSAQAGLENEIRAMVNFSEGKLRQIGVFMTVLDNAIEGYYWANFTNIIRNIQAVALEFSAQNKPFSVLFFNPEVNGVRMPLLPDLTTMNADRVSVLLGTDGGGLGGYLFSTQGLRVGMLGAVLGAVSRAKVNESIAWVERQNLVTTAYSKSLTGDVQQAKELDVPAFVDGSLVSSYTADQLATIHGKGYIFGLKHVGFAGTYLNDSFTATVRNSDYAYIENNRTMDKAQRGVYAVLLPKISGPLLIDAASGALREDVVAGLEALAAQPLEQMERDGEISGFKVFINLEQEVLQTSTLTVTLSVVPVGVMRNIVVNLGFALQV